MSEKTMWVVMHTQLVDGQQVDVPIAVCESESDALTFALGYTWDHISDIDTPEQLPRVWDAQHIPTGAVSVYERV